MAMARNRAARSGTHPRQARITESDSSTANLPGPDLNEGIDQELSDTAAKDDTPKQNANERELDDESLADGQPPRPRKAPRRNKQSTEGSTRQQQPKVVEKAVGEEDKDWTKFDIGRSIRILRIGTEAQITRELRKLHLRWWHATRSQMEKTLGLAGVPRKVIDMIPGIVDTCRECRAWAPPKADITPAVELVTAQNDTIEADLMFYKGVICMNMVDVCDRFHASGPVDNREMETLLEAIDVIWITVLGAFKNLVIDGETSLNTKHAEDRLKAMGITLKPRAPHQHARIVERRQAILRQAMHAADEQLKNEGVPTTVKQVLAWCTHAGNALITYDGATPFNARFGRQPAMLPDLHIIPDDKDGRDLQRIREVAIQKIIEASAYERINGRSGQRRRQQANNWIVNRATWWTFGAPVVLKTYQDGNSEQ